MTSYGLAVDVIPAGGCAGVPISAVVFFVDALEFFFVFLPLPKVRERELEKLMQIDERWEFLNSARDENEGTERGEQGTARVTTACLEDRSRYDPPRNLPSYELNWKVEMMGKGGGTAMTTTTTTTVPDLVCLRFVCACPPVDNDEYEACPPASDHVP